MAHAYFHARSSAKSFGGTWGDYIELHNFMDSTKAHIADSRHRLVLHNTWGIFFVEKIFGEIWIRKSDGKPVPTRSILEKHVLEDLKRIPSLQECFANVPIEPWQYKNSMPLSQEDK